MHEQPEQVVHALAITTVSVGHGRRLTGHVALAASARAPTTTKARHAELNFEPAAADQHPGDDRGEVPDAALFATNS